MMYDATLSMQCCRARKVVNIFESNGSVAVTTVIHNLLRPYGFVHVCSALDQNVSFLLFPSSVNSNPIPKPVSH